MLNHDVEFNVEFSIVNSRFTIQNGYEQGLSFQWMRDAHTGTTCPVCPVCVPAPPGVFLPVQ